MEPTYDETYCVTTATVGSPALMQYTSQELADILQQAYSADNLPGAAGMFQVKRLGRITVFTFERDIREDLEVLEERGWPPTPASIVGQLRGEFLEVLNCTGEEHEALTDVLNAMLTGMTPDQAEVQGLPCQYPTRTLKITVRFRDNFTATRAEDAAKAGDNHAGLGSFRTAVEALAASLNGELVSVAAEGE